MSSFRVWEQRTERLRPKLLTSGVAVLAAATLALTACSAAEPAPTSPDTQGSTSELGSLLPEDIRAAGKITVGTEAFYPPYTYFDEDNTTIIGIDASIAAALGEVLGVELVLEHTAWEGLLPGLLASRYDMVIGGTTVTEERLEQYDIVSYFETDHAFTAVSGNPEEVTEIADICGKSIAVLDASPQLNMLTDYNDSLCADNPIDVQGFPSDSDALLQLRNGRAELHFAQRPVSIYNVDEVGGGSFEILDLGSIGSGEVGVVFRQDTPELRDAIVAAFEAIMTDGTYQEALDGFGLGDGAMSSPTVHTLGTE